MPATETTSTATASKMESGKQAQAPTASPSVEQKAIATVVIEFFTGGKAAEITVKGGEVLSPGKLNRVITRVYRAVGKSKMDYRIARRLAKEKADAAGN